MTFNSPWECRIGLTAGVAEAIKQAMLQPFNSPWECRIGLTKGVLNDPSAADVAFQFPVGMSNRSYLYIPINVVSTNIIPFNSPWECRIGLTLEYDNLPAAEQYVFQFPVGMSNRSYKCLYYHRHRPLCPFNSPWECRIGLTPFMNGGFQKKSVELSIPRGNVE